MKRLLRSRIVLAGLFGVMGAAAALAATGNLPVIQDDEEPKSVRVVDAESVDRSDAGRAFTARTETAPREPATGATRRTTGYVYDDDYRSQLYEQYFGYEEEEEDDDQVVYVAPEDDGGGSGQAGEPGEPGIPDGDGEDGGGEGGPAGPGGAGGGD